MVKRKVFRSRLKRLLLGLLFAFLLVTVAQVLLLKWINPLGSSFMLGRISEAWLDGDWQFRIDYRWRDYERISPQLPLAVVAAEDQRFPAHRGFDLAAMKKAYQGNQRGRKVRGGSTISQQLAKNLFLWSGRSYLRKGLEAWYTLLIETFWSKRRILEVYVNVVEFGDGVYGAEAASRRYYRMSSAKLSASQAARLAAVLPNPKRYRVAAPGPYVRARSHGIERQMRHLGGPSYLNACCQR